MQSDKGQWSKRRGAPRARGYDQLGLLAMLKLKKIKSPPEAPPATKLAMLFFYSF
jgi:hypothetical protein